VFLLSLVAGLQVHAQEPPQDAPIVLAQVNKDALAVLADASVSESARAQASAQVLQVFSTPQRLARVPSREEVARYWQAHGLRARLDR